MSDIKEKWWEPFLKLALHIVVGGLTFLVIALIAIAIDEFLNYCEAKNVNPHLLQTFRGLDAFVLYLDICLFAFIVIMSAAEFVVSLIRNFKKSLQ